MSVEVTCDRCGATSPFMGEDYARGRYVYMLPSGWTRESDLSDEPGAHVCKKCHERPSDDAIRALRTEAGAAGDSNMVAACDKALSGDTPPAERALYRDLCAKAIQAARDARGR